MSFGVEVRADAAAAAAVESRLAFVSVVAAYDGYDVAGFNIGESLALAPLELLLLAAFNEVSEEVEL